MRLGGATVDALREQLVRVVGIGLPCTFEAGAEVLDAVAALAADLAGACESASRAP